MHSFIAIDVETANADLSSICQIGLAFFKNGQVINEWVSFVDPEDDFDAINVGIHGIDELVIVGAPTFPQIADKLRAFLSGQVVICHTHFDKAAMMRICEKYELPEIDCHWLDSARVARRAWEEVAQTGYGLKNVCSMIGYKFKHHDALEDAKAAGQIILAAIEKTGITIVGWLERVKKTIGEPKTEKTTYRGGDPSGPLWGERAVFTGSLSIPRPQAANIAAAIGCNVDNNVTKNTTILIVGDQDTKKLNNKEKSNKHLKAEKFISEGQLIRILLEKDFKALFDDSTSNITYPVTINVELASGDGFKEVTLNRRSKPVEGTRKFEFNLIKVDQSLAWHQIMRPAYDAMDGKGFRLNLVWQEKKLTVIACEKVVIGFIPDGLTTLLASLDLTSYWGYVAQSRRSREEFVLYLSPRSPLHTGNHIMLK